MLWTGKQSVVYVKPNASESIFQMREVLLGNKIGEDYQVISGLENGEEVVVNGAFTVDAAAQLQGIKSMMTYDNNKSMELEPTMNLSDAQMMPSPLQKIIKEYLMLKDDLVASNYEKAHHRIALLVKNIKEVSLKDSNLSSIIDAMKLDLNQMEQSKNLEDLRKAFRNFSQNIVLLKNESPYLSNYIVQFCPMASENMGGVWLSDSKQIRNPYFGESMLECGSIQK